MCVGALVAGCVMGVKAQEASVLSCPEGDLIYSRINEILEAQPTAPGSAEQSYGQFVAWAYPQLAKSKPRVSVIARTEEAVNFSVEVDGRVQALVQAERRGQTAWYVTSLTACGSLVEKYSQGGEW